LQGIHFGYPCHLNHRDFRRIDTALTACVGSFLHDTAESMSNLASTYFYLGKYDEALRIQRQSLKTLQKELEPGHLRIAGARNNLAVTLNSLGHHGEALLLFKQALTINIGVYGSNHRETAISLVNLSASPNLLLTETSFGFKPEQQATLRRMIEERIKDM